MQDILMEVNWIAVIVGAVAAYALGWAWYSPKLFGAKWAEGVGVDINDGSGPNMHAMVAQAVGTFLLAWTIGVTEVTSNLWLAILVAVTIATLIKTNGLFVNKSKYAIWTEAGYILAMVVVMVVAQAIF